VDNYAGAKLAVDHLIEQGHTAIGMLVGVESATSPIRRVNGFRDALATHGLHANDDWIVSGPATLTSGYDHARELLTQHPEITAVFAYNDLMALGALRACRDVGLSVPGDCAVVGFDNIQLAGMVTPSLTSIHIDKYALGQEAMARLLEMINNPDETFPPISVNPDLIIRESTVSMNAHH
jgi:LacI family transcriptional regulator